MAKCDQCGREENMPYSCGYCGGTFCAEHRLPENHVCPGLEDWDDPEGVFDSGFDDTVRHEGGRSGGLTGRLGLSTGAGGPLGYFRGNMTYVFLGLMWITFLLQFAVAFVLPPFGNIALSRGHPLWRALFLLSSEHPLYVWTWVTSVFAHGGFAHIAINSIVLYFFGPLVERRVGSRKFVALFLVAGMVAGLAQVGTTILLDVMNSQALPASRVLGASGAIMAIMGVLTVLNPNLRVYLYFILPVPLWLLTLGFALYSVFIALGGGIGAGGVAHLAHLAGLLIGLAYGEKLRREGQQLPSQVRFGPGGSGPGGPGGPGRRW